MTREQLRPATACLVVFLGTLAAFLVQKWHSEIVMIDTRFALFASEGLERGFAPFPWLYGRLYPDYPALGTLLTQYSAQLFGVVNFFTIVLPSAVAGAVLTTLVAVIGMRLRDLRYGVTAALLLFGAFEFISIGRIVSLDLYVAVAAAGSFLLAELADARRLPHWAARSGILLCFALGLLTRGPIGLVIPCAVVLSYDFISRKFLRGIVSGAAAALLLAAFIAVFYHLAGVWGGPDFAREFWEMQVASRMEDTKPFWYYFTNAVGSFAFTYPLALLVFVTALVGWKKRFFTLPPGECRDLDALRCAAGWLFIIVLGMSIPGTKHLRYLAPAMPAAALLAAAFFVPTRGVEVLEPLRKLVLKLVPWLIPVAAVAVAAGTLILMLPGTIRMIGVPVRLPLPALLTALAALGALAVVSRKLPDARRDFCRLFILCALVWCARVLINEPVDECTLSSRRFVAACENFRRPGEAVWFCRLGPDGDENKYMVHVDRSRFFIPRYCNDVPELEELPEGALVVARQDKFLKLAPPEVRRRFAALAAGRLSRRQCLLLRALPHSAPASVR